MLIQDLVEPRLAPYYHLYRGCYLEEGRGGMKAAIASAFAMLGGLAHADEFTYDSDGRIIAQVEVNGQGPFNFMVDTGANRTVVSQALARRLNLQVSDTTEISGATNRSSHNIVQLDNISSGEIDHDDVTAIVLPNNSLGNLHGIIGGDSFRGRRILIDMRNRQYSIGPSIEPTNDFHRIQGEVGAGRLLFVNVMINGHQIEALVDTGSEMTLVNRAFLEATGLRSFEDEDNPRSYTGAGGTQFNVRQVNLRRWSAGDVQLPNVTAQTTNLPFFRDNPGIVIGMDVWSRMRVVAVDLERAELQIVP